MDLRLERPRDRFFLLLPRLLDLLLALRDFLLDVFFLAFLPAFLPFFPRDRLRTGEAELDPELELESESESEPEPDPESLPLSPLLPLRERCFFFVFALAPPALLRPADLVTLFPPALPASLSLEALRVDDLLRLRLALRSRLRDALSSRARGFLVVSRGAALRFVGVGDRDGDRTQTNTGRASFLICTRLH